MTFHKGGDGQPSRLTCTHYHYDSTAGPASEDLKKIFCTATVTGRPTAAALRRLAREQGWQHHEVLGDRCPQHVYRKLRNFARVGKPGPLSY